MARLMAMSSSRTASASSTRRRRISLAGHGRVQSLHAFDGPKEIHGGWARVGERVADGLHLSIELPLAGAQHAQRHAHGGGHADSRRAADDHAADGGRHLLIRPAGHVLFFEWQARLVDHDDAPVGPLDCLYHSSH
jgi:hypothetical protein